MLYFEITIGPMYIAMTHDCLMGLKTFLQKKSKMVSNIIAASYDYKSKDQVHLRISVNFILEYKVILK